MSIYSALDAAVLSTVEAADVRSVWEAVDATKYSTVVTALDATI